MKDISKNKKSGYKNKEKEQKINQVETEKKVEQEKLTIKSQ